MPITEVGSNVAGTTGTAISVTHGISIAAGDVIIVQINNNGTSAVSDNNGAFTFVNDFTTTYASARFGVWSRIAGATEPAAYAFTIAASQRWSLIIRVFRSVDVDIYDVAPAAGNFAEDTSTTPTAPSITIANAGAMGLFTALLDYNNGVFSGPSDNYGTEVERQAAQSMASYIRIWDAPGATTTVQCTMDSGSDDWGACQFALKPAAVAAGGNPYYYYAQQ
jgi:hypothetical protein